MLKRRGRGWAACYLKVGMLRSQDASSAIVELKQDGSLVVLVGSVEVGAGTTTVAAQIAAEVLGVNLDTVSVVYGDTETTPYDGGTVGSRSTYMMGNAVRIAAGEVRDALFQTAAEELEVSVDDLEFAGWFRPSPRRTRPRHLNRRSCLPHALRSAAHCDRPGNIPACNRTGATHRRPQRISS